MYLAKTAGGEIERMKPFEINEKLYKHYKEAKEIADGRLVAVLLQGSQNYGLDYEKSDIDSKAILVPSFNDIVLNKKPISTTHIRDNEEHIDLKDIRLMFQCYKKQNLNFVETLFTKYKFIKQEYWVEWEKLINAREQIARYNPFAAVKSMKGIAMEKYHALKHPYPIAIKEIEKFGYSSKQLHHLLRVEDFLYKYIAGVPYEECITPTEIKRDELLRIKANPGLFTPETAEKIAANALINIENMADDYCLKVENKGNQEIEDLFNEVLTNIIKMSIRSEIL